MKGNRRQSGIGELGKALSDEHRGTRRGNHAVAARLLSAWHFVACTLLLILADAASAFAQAASAAQGSMDVVDERLRVSGLLPSILMALLLFNFFIAASVWLARARTTKRQMLVAVGLGALGSLAVALGKASSQVPNSSGGLIPGALGTFLLFFFPVSVWLVSLCEIFKTRSPRSNVYLVVSGLLFLAVFGWRTAAVHFHDDINLAESSDEQHSVEAHGSAGSVEGVQ